MSTLIRCDSFYDTDTHRILIHVPEELKPKDNDNIESVPEQPRRRGRPTIYASDEERKAKHREQALRHYYRKKALSKTAQSFNDSDDEICLTINTHSKTLGDIAEDIKFKRVNGRLRKQHSVANAYKQ